MGSFLKGTDYLASQEDSAEQAEDGEGRGRLACCPRGVTESEDTTGPGAPRIKSTAQATRGTGGPDAAEEQKECGLGRAEDLPRGITNTDLPEMAQPTGIPEGKVRQAPKNNKRCVSNTHTPSY